MPYPQKSGQTNVARGKTLLFLVYKNLKITSRKGKLNIVKH